MPTINGRGGVFKSCGAATVAGMAQPFNVQKFLEDRLGRQLPSDSVVDVRFSSCCSPSVAITGSQERAAFVEDTRSAFARVLQLPPESIELRNIKVPPAAS